MMEFFINYLISLSVLHALWYTAQGQPIKGKINQLLKKGAWSKCNFPDFVYFLSSEVSRDEGAMASRQRLCLVIQGSGINPSSRYTWECG